MKPIELKVARIGNSRGVRLPAATLERYQIGDRVVMEERSDGILLRPAGKMPALLSWEETAQQMQAAAEDWNDWDTTVADALEGLTWKAARSRKVAEPAASSYEARKPRKKR